MFAGSCLAADPEGMNGAVAIYPGASRPAATAVTPGGTSSATVPLHTMIVQTRTSRARPARTSPVTAKNVTDTGCPTQVTYALGTTDASGNLTVALPYGSWIVGATGTTNTVTKLLSPLVPATQTATVSW